MTKTILSWPSTLCFHTPYSFPMPPPPLKKRRRRNELVPEKLCRKEQRNYVGFIRRISLQHFVHKLPLKHCHIIRVIKVPYLCKNLTIDCSIATRYRLYFRNAIFFFPRQNYIRAKEISYLVRFLISLSYLCH